jgi:hypothetical protein
VRFKVVFAPVVVAALIGASAGVALATNGPLHPAATSGTPAGGPVKIFVTPNNGAAAPILVTGAIGDYGTTLMVDKNGKTDPDGNYIKVTLHKGSFEFNATALNAKANSSRPTFYKATCSALDSVTGPVTAINGTGAYKGITGALSITETYAFLSPLSSSGENKGQCNLSAQPISQYSSILGSGAVSFH